MSANLATLLLGSNLGNPEANIREALALLKGRCSILAEGDFHFSEAEGFQSSNTFCNLAISVATELSPIQLLSFLKETEKNMGRKEDSGAEKTYRDRIIDIDIVTFKNICYEAENLTIPHALHLYGREFSRPVLESLQKNLSNTEF